MPRRSHASEEGVGGAAVRGMACSRLGTAAMAAAHGPR